jgi:hypothetical protein
MSVRNRNIANITLEIKGIKKESGVRNIPSHLASKYNLTLTEIDEIVKMVQRANYHSARIFTVMEDDIVHAMLRLVGMNKEQKLRVFGGTSDYDFQIFRGHDFTLWEMEEMRNIFKAHCEK